MDFTKVYNSGDGITKIPQCVLDLIHGAGFDYDIADNCIQRFTEDGDTIFEVGIRNPGDVLNNPPDVIDYGDILCEAMDFLCDDEDEKAEERFLAFAEYDHDVVKGKTNNMRSDISRAETNIEKCFFNTRDLDAEVQDYGKKGIAFLNPSVGTMKRYNDVFALAHVPTYIIDNDEEYVRRMNMLSESLGIPPPICCPLLSLPDCYVYYSGFRSDMMRAYNKKRVAKGCRSLHYVGFVPNLLALAGRNVTVVAHHVKDGYFIYDRKGENVCVRVHGHSFVTKADVLTHTMSGLRYYVRSQGIVHDFVSSLPFDQKTPVIAARPLPVDPLVPIKGGKVVSRDDGVYIGNTMIVDHRGTLVPDQWTIPDNMNYHRYMTTFNHGAIYDLGGVIRVSDVDTLCTINGELDVLKKVSLVDHMGDNVLICDGHFYIPDVEGTICFRRSKYGSVHYLGANYSRETIGDYEITMSHIIQYSNKVLDMYGVKYIDVTSGDMVLVGENDNICSASFGET